MLHYIVMFVAIGINIIIFVKMTSEFNSFVERLDNEMSQVIRLLAFGIKDERGTKKIVDEIEASFQSSSTLKSLWENYKNTLLPQDWISKDSFYSATDSSEFFNLENLMESSRAKVSFSIWNAVPQVLTSVGIIGTFASILVSLNGLLASGNNKIDDRFIMSLVTALASGFWSSLAGIFFAVCFIGYEKFKTKQMNVIIHDLNSSINQRFPKITIETILLKQQHSLDSLSTGITSSISQGFSEMTGGFSTALKDVIDDETKNTIKRGVSDSFNQLNAVFTELLNETKGLKGELDALKQSKIEVLATISKINTDQNSLQEQVAKQSNALLENIREMEKVIAPLADIAKQVQTNSEISEKLLSAVANVTAAAHSIETALSNTHQVTERNLTNLNTLATQISSEYGTMGATVEDWVKQSNGSLENNLQQFDSSMHGVLSKLVNLSDTFNTGLINLEKTVGLMQTTKVRHEA